MQIARNRTLRLCRQFFVLLLALVVTDRCCAAEPPLLLKGGTIHAMDGKAAYIGSVLIVDGKIKQVGKNIKAPKGAKVIDVTGYQVTPGLIDCRSKLWITESAINDSGSKAEVEIELGVDPWLDQWRELASQGITSVYVQPASGGLMGGYGSWFNVGPASSVDEIVFDSKTGLQCSLGLSGNSQSRANQIKAFNKLFETAKKELDKEKAKDKSTSSSSKKTATSKKTETKKETPEKEKPKATPPQEKQKDAESESDSKDEEKKDEKDPLKIALRKLLQRELALSVEVHHADTLKAVLRTAEKYNLRVILGGLGKIGDAAETLGEANLPMVIGPLMPETSPPAYRKGGSRDWLASVVNEEGRLWAITGYPKKAIQSRDLRMQAAAAIRQGAAHASVLKAITINPARMFGVADKVGSIEAGKVANLAVFAGDPLDPATPVRMALCNGTITHDVEHPAGKLVATEPLSSAELPESLPKSYTIHSNRILGPDGKFYSGMLAVKDGKFVKPNGKQKAKHHYDLGDHVVTPGLVNAWTTLGQESVIWDSTESDMSHIRAIDGIDPAGKSASKFLAAGVIHIGVPPTAKSTSSGILGHLRLGSVNYVAKSDCASQFVLSAAARDANRFPSSLSAQFGLIQNLLSGSIAESNIYLSDTLANAIAQEKRDNLKTLVSGQRKSLFVADEVAEIRTAIRLSKQFKLSPILAAKSNVQEVVDDLAEHSFAMIVAENADAIDENLQQLVLLNSKGVSFAFASGTPEGIRHAAARLANAGMPAANVRGGLTVQGAKSMGMQSTSLTAGNPADFVIWDGDPLNLASQPIQVFVDGNLKTEK